jgi:hypothetical protein
MRHFLILSGMLLFIVLRVHCAEELRRFDNNGDGRTDQWEYYSDGVLIRVESDRHYNDRADEMNGYFTSRAKSSETTSTQIGTARSISESIASPRVMRNG